MSAFRKLVLLLVIVLLLVGIVAPDAGCDTGQTESQIFAGEDATYCYYQVADHTVGGWRMVVVEK